MTSTVKKGLKAQKREARSTAGAKPVAKPALRVLGLRKAPQGGFFRVMAPVAPSRFSEDEIQRAVDAALASR